MTDFEDRIEGEIKTHEAEMLKKAVIAKYGSKSLPERITYIMERYNQPKWTAEEIFTKLNDTGLIGENTLEEVTAALTDPDNKFPVTAAK